MNSEERHELRYLRRKQNRILKRNAKLSQVGKYDDIFTYSNLYDAFHLCKKGVRWKGSIQKYEVMLPLETLSIYNSMKNRRFKTKGFLEFDLCERGKLRHIKAVKIEERCIQRVLCDHYLSPLLEPQLIYDNAASIKGKGIDFSLKRLKCHLLRYYRKYHTNKGYILQYDFSSYFDNIDHDTLLQQMKKYLPDEEIFAIIQKIVKSFGYKGLGLGSQVSQIAAIFYPTLLDKYFKEVLHKKWYGRYMDDGYIICHDLVEVVECKMALIRTCQQLKIKINFKKLSVSKLSKSFIFLKKRVRMTESGAVVMRIGRAAVIRARRRIKKLIKKAYDPNEKFTYVDLYQCYQCWMGITKRFKNYYILQNFRKLYLSLVAHYNKITKEVKYA